MGQCNSSGQSRAFTLEELSDLKVGETKEMGRGCGPDIGGTQGGSCYDWLSKRGFGWPNNGEFNWGGIGNSCSMCSDVGKGYGCDNCSGAEAIGGKRGSVKRIAFTADDKLCCKQQIKMINGKTCDPKYLKNYEDDACDVQMKEYCVGDTLTTNECQKWINTALNKERSIPNISLKNYCSQGTNFSNLTCQTWCDKVRNIPKMAGECDQVVFEYCKNNTTDPLCNCLNPPETITKVEGLISSAKVCWYRACKDLTNDNFITSNMRDQKKNCVSTVCTIDTNDVQISGTDNKVEFTNACVANILKPKTPEEIAREQEQEKEKQEIAKLVAEKEAANANPTEPPKPNEPTGDRSVLIVKITLSIGTFLFFIVSILAFKKSTTMGVIMVIISLILLTILIYLLISYS